MADEILNLPANLAESIADFMKAQEYINSMCIRNVNNLAATIEANSAVITAVVFDEILAEQNKTSMTTLPDIYAVRNDVVKRIYAVRNDVVKRIKAAEMGEAPVATAPAVAAPSVVSVTPTEPVAEAPAALADGFGEPLLTAETAPAPAAAASAPQPKKLSAAGNNPVITTATGGVPEILVTTPPVADISAAFASAPLAVTAELDVMVDAVADELPPPPTANEVTIDVVAETVETVNELTTADYANNVTAAFNPAANPVVDVLPDTTTTLPSPAPIEPEEPASTGRGRGGRRSATTVVANDPESIIRGLFVKLDEKDKRIAELEKALAETTANTVKFSAQTVKRLQEMGLVEVTSA